MKQNIAPLIRSQRLKQILMRKMLMVYLNRPMVKSY